MTATSRYTGFQTGMETTNTDSKITVMSRNLNVGLPVHTAVSNTVIRDADRRLSYMHAQSSSWRH